MNEQGLIDTGLQDESIHFGIASKTTVEDYLKDLGTQSGSILILEKCRNVT